MNVRGKMKIKAEDFNLAFEKMKEEISKNGIKINKILCNPINNGPCGIRNSLNFVGHYIIEFLFLGEKDNENSIYSCSCHTLGFASEYVMDRPGAYPNPEVGLWEGIENIKIEKETGPISEILYNYYGWLIYEYEFIYQPANNDSDLYYLKLGHDKNTIFPSRSILDHSKITSLSNKGGYLCFTCESNPEMKRISYSKSLYDEAPNTEDILNKINSKQKKLKLNVCK